MAVFSVSRLLFISVDPLLGLISYECVRQKDEAVEDGQGTHGQTAGDGVVGGRSAGQGRLRLLKSMPRPHRLDAQSEVAASPDEVPPLQSVFKFCERDKTKLASCMAFSFSNV